MHLNIVLLSRVVAWFCTIRSLAQCSQSRGHCMNPLSLMRVLRIEEALHQHLAGVGGLASCLGGLASDQAG